MAKKHRILWLMLVCMGQNQPLEGTSDSKASMGPAGAFAVRAPQLSRSICPIICHLTPIGLDPKGGPINFPHVYLLLRVPDQRCGTRKGKLKCLQEVCVDAGGQGFRHGAQGVAEDTDL